MKLIKIKEDHYVVVDNSEIKEGDWYAFKRDNIWYIFNTLPNGNFRKESLGVDVGKITHSTQPVEGTLEGYEKYGFEGLPKHISVQEVKELIGEVDVMTKAVRDIEGTSWDEDAKPSFLSGYLRGYRQALEDNKEKKYTEKELIWAIQEAYGHGQNDEFDGIFHLAESIKAITEYLQPKTEWEVELETIDNRQPCHCQCHNNIDMVHFVACCNDGWIGTVTQKLKLK